MGFSDYLWEVEQELTTYRDRYYPDHTNRLDQLLCDIIKLRMEADYPSVTPPNTAFYLAVSAGDFETYARLAEEQKEHIRHG